MTKRRSAARCSARLRPSLEHINVDPQFEAKEIEEAEFEKLWAIRRQ